MSSIERAREQLVDSIDKRLHISQLTNGFYEKTSDILMKTAFGFLMDDWIASGLLPQDFRGEEAAKKFEATEEECSEKKKSSLSSRRPPPQGKLKTLVDKFEKSDSGHVSASTSTESEPPKTPDLEVEEQDKILNDVDLEDLFDDTEFEAQKDEDKQIVAVEDDTSKEIIPVDEIEETERQAQLLIEQAQITFAENAVEFQEAYSLQQDALLKSHDANVKTAKALINQEYGTALLAEAGAEMIEAGAHYQREALASERQVPVNNHQEGVISQGVSVSSESEESAAKAHETVTIKHVEQVNVEQVTPVY